MPKLLQINITANWGSHGRIAEEIGQLAMSQGWESHIAYSRWANPSQSHLIRIGSMWDERWHGIQSRLFDNHGLASKKATQKLIEEIKRISPDIIHLHNIHGYYLNYPLLFEFLAGSGLPVVWTLHDCWPFTGHCSHPIYADCYKWQIGCNHCAALSSYPKSILFDRSERNYNLKKDYFNRINNLTLVSVSRWLDKQVSQSFLGHHRHLFIYNGVDCQTFVPYFDKRNHNEYFVLGVANVWNTQKGLDVFYKLRDSLPKNYHILLVGLNKRQIKSLPNGIEGILRTDSVEKLVKLYSRADVFVNPSQAETFGLTTAEALACGTPCVVYDTSACPELINEETGHIVPLNDIPAMTEAIREICEVFDSANMRNACRKRALRLFDKSENYKRYWYLYQSIIA
jgi:glycosyltransferase involved in cell wall biosynthesis